MLLKSLEERKRMGNMKLKAKCTMHGLLIIFYIIIIETDNTSATENTIYACNNYDYSSYMNIKEQFESTTKLLLQRDDLKITAELGQGVSSKSFSFHDYLCD